MLTTNAKTTVFFDISTWGWNVILHYYSHFYFLIYSFYSNRFSKQQQIDMGEKRKKNIDNIYWFIFCLKHIVLSIIFSAFKTQIQIKMYSRLFDLLMMKSMLNKCDRLWASERSTKVCLNFGRILLFWNSHAAIPILWDGKIRNLYH